ncbi:hypothetical protein DP939_24635 [Spongiactinospora rosea]|uniref:Uncharacterized protein n=1 Tax=Spongiactinospora rosea TaxID=2248750 RepID=A0A366LUD8_9ACTN|nr:hypothetical protein [Spongiactinospora rosea]RBQ17551.1 hypothetical protein DP939_24635 [Spongiactinospora rosea]
MSDGRAHRLVVSYVDPRHTNWIRLRDEAAPGSGVWISRPGWSTFLAEVREGAFEPDRGTSGSIRLAVGDLIPGLEEAVTTTPDAWADFQRRVTKGEFDQV